MINRISNCIQKSKENFSTILKDENLLQTIEQIVKVCIDAFRNDKKMLLCGNGGSASDAQHIAAELSGRFYKDRKPLYAEALHVNSSYITAVANDYGYEETYARMTEAAGRKEDVLLGISTSGNSPNVVKAMQKAKEMDMITIGFTGEDGGKMKGICDIIIRVPSSDTPRIQEAHILIGHIICQLIEEELF
ncbi:MAG: D-sedoheptulose 7-phosphate isomerase [Flavobacteriales bacterium]|nr:D-sedoheptulose 7-phosphate isomerase [Flavobacteriales bacterium]